MPLSFKSQLKKLAHKGQITAEEYDALVIKLAGHDREIRAKAIEEFMKVAIKELNDLALERDPSVVYDCKFILRKIADQLKEK